MRRQREIINFLKQPWGSKHQGQSVNGSIHEKTVLEVIRVLWSHDSNWTERGFRYSIDAKPSISSSDNWLLLKSQIRDISSKASTCYTLSPEPETSIISEEDLGSVPYRRATPEMLQRLPLYHCPVSFWWIYIMICFCSRKAKVSDSACFGCFFWSLKLTWDVDLVVLRAHSRPWSL